MVKEYGFNEIEKYDFNDTDAYDFNCVKVTVTAFMLMLLSYAFHDNDE